MILAVQLFISPNIKFKTEVFSVLANISWTYLMHENFIRSNVSIFAKGGRTLALSTMLAMKECPLSKGIKNNLNALKEIRDSVEHHLLGQGDLKFYSIFQACCLNYEKTICELLGRKVSLAHELGIALQFSKLNLEQISQLQEADVPEEVAALDARLNDSKSEEELADTEYRFKVVYTLDSAKKGEAHFRFISPNSEEATEIRNVLVKHRTKDELYPYKPAKVVKLVSDGLKKTFNHHHHRLAWTYYKAREKPLKSGAKPSTDERFCIYHDAHGDFTYSETWVQFLIETLSNSDEFARLKAVKL